jgi:hypothetical protein
MVSDPNPTVYKSENVTTSTDTITDLAATGTASQMSTPTPEAFTGDASRVGLAFGAMIAAAVAYIL